MARKKILICLDGTGNDPADTEQELGRDGQQKDGNISNVLKLHLLAGGNLQNEPWTAVQHSFYYSGVGTRGSLFRRVLAKALALRAPDKIINEAYDDLCSSYVAGDKIFIFGFSRGAAIARKLASKIAKEGVVTGQGIQHVEISLLGAWDTVASFGKPNLHSAEHPVSDVLFENGTIAPNIRKACHLLALDETRIAFRPTLMNNEERVLEVWFPGVHSDIGGGYRRDGLSDISLSFMLEQAKLAGIDFIEASAIDFVGIQQESGVSLELDDVEVKPDALAFLHERKRDEKIASRTLKAREVFVSVNDTASDHAPVLHHSVVERIQNTSGINYRPKNLQALRHTVLGRDTIHDGLETHTARA